MTKHLNNCFIKVSDDWYGNYDGNKVKVTFIEDRGGTYGTIVVKPHFAVTVSGNDDFGMIKEFIYSDYKTRKVTKRDALELFVSIKMSKPFNKDKAKELGLIEW